MIGSAWTWTREIGRSEVGAGSTKALRAVSTATNMVAGIMVFLFQEHNACLGERAGTTARTELQLGLGERGVAEGIQLPIVRLARAPGPYFGLQLHLAWG